MTHVTWFLVIATGLACGKRADHPALAASTPSVALQQWLDVFGQGDEKALLAFVERWFSPTALAEIPAPDRVSDMAMRFADTRGLDLERTLASSPGAAAIVARAHLTGFSYRVSAAAASDVPQKLATLSIALEPPVLRRAAAAAPIAPAEVARDLGRFVDHLAREDAFSGVVLITRGDDVVYAAAHGLADRDARTPNTLDTRFNVASVGKMFTAVAALQLVERGELALQTTVAQRVTDYTGAGADTITLAQLLTHTSGLGDFFGARFQAERLHLRAIRDYLPLFADEPLAFAPGHGWRYSNAGYVLVGRMIEIAAGTSFFERVASAVFEPAGMAATAYLEADAAATQVAIGYTQFVPNRDDAHFRFRLAAPRSNQDVQAIKGAPSGGAFSTVGDLTAFVRALCTGKLLDRRIVADMTRAHARTERGVDQGYGIQIEREAGRLVVGHTGGDLGVAAFLHVFPDSDYIAAVLANRDRGANLVALAARALITATAPVSRPRYAACAGAGSEPSE